MYRFVLFYGSFSQVNLLAENKEQQEHAKKEKATNDSYFVCMTHAIKTRKLLWTQLMFQGKMEKKWQRFDAKYTLCLQHWTLKCAGNKKPTAEQKLPHPFMIFVRKHINSQADRHIWIIRFGSQTDEEQQQNSMMSLKVPIKTSFWSTISYRRSLKRLNKENTRSTLRSLYCSVCSLQCKKLCISNWNEKKK